MVEKGWKGGSHHPFRFRRTHASFPLRGGAWVCQKQ
jgi:hypothetical protein